jgi:hypothetical protein
VSTPSYYQHITEDKFKRYILEYLERTSVNTLYLVVKCHLIFKFDPSLGIIIEAKNKISAKEEDYVRRSLDKYLNKYPFWECLTTSKEIH